MVSLMAGAAEAQIGQPVRIPGAVITTDPTQIRWVFALGPERVAYVNAANEVYVHRVANNRIEAFARYGTTTVGVPNNPIDYALAEDENSVIVITQRGDVFRHDMRRNSIGAAAQIPGAPVGTAGQEQVFMFMVGNQLINVTRAGEIWAHEISRGTIQAPRRLGRYAITAPAVPRHAFVIGRTVYVISDQGQIFAHDIHPELGEGRLLNRGREHADLGDPNTRFVFVMGPRLIAINGNGEVWARDVSRLYPRRPIPPGQVPPGQAPPAAPQ
jgi:hypothetical protein